MKDAIANILLGEFDNSLWYLISFDNDLQKRIIIW